MQVQIPNEVFEIGILNAKHHDRLIANLPKFAAIAGIPVEFVWSKASAYLTDADLTWLRNMREGKNYGLVYSGVFPIPVEDKMMAIAGACLRNYIDARFMTVQEVLRLLKDDDMPQSAVILVPNFCMSKEDSSNVSSWQAASLLGWLYQRMAKGLKTVLYVGDFNTLEAAYGTAMVKHLKAHYDVI